MRQHTAAVKARIQEIPQLASRVFVASARKTDGALQAPPYVLLYPSEGTDTQETYTGPRSRQHPAFTIHIVGTSYDNVQTLTEAIKPLFVVNGFGVPPAVSGERTFNLTWESPTPIQWDFDVPDRLYQVIELGFDAEKES